MSDYEVGFVERVLLNISLRRYDPTKESVQKQLEKLKEAGYVEQTPDGWQLTGFGDLALMERGWSRYYVRRAEGGALLPGLFEMPDVARQFDEREGVLTIHSPAYVHETGLMYL